MLKPAKVRRQETWVKTETEKKLDMVLSRRRMADMKHVMSIDSASVDQYQEKT